MLGSVERAHARFVETRHSALLKSPLVLEGTLAYRRPDRVEKHVQSPYDERITVEGGRLTLENRAQNRKKTLSVSGAPGLAALIESIRATRAGDLAALQRHYALQVEGSRDAVDPHSQAARCPGSGIRQTDCPVRLRVSHSPDRR